MSKHTPKPWRAVRDPSHFGSLSTVVGGEATDVWPNQTLIVSVGGSAPIEEQEANTRLVSASPNLYAVVSRLLAMIDDGYSMRDCDGAQHTEFDALAAAARAAIDAAGGGA